MKIGRQDEQSDTRVVFMWVFGGFLAIAVKIKRIWGKTRLDVLMKKVREANFGD